MFLSCAVGECLPVSVLAVPYYLWCAIHKTNHVVFPVSNMISKFLAQHCVALVVGVEIHVECINEARAVVVHDYGAGDGVVGFSS